MLVDAGLPELGLLGLDNTTAAVSLAGAALLLPLWRARLRVLREAAGNSPCPPCTASCTGPLWTSAQLLVPGVLPLTERLERASSWPLVGSTRGDLPSSSWVAALNDEDSWLSEILLAASTAWAAHGLDLDAAAPAVEAGIVELDLH